ncbi:Bacitracin export ATP-binding protein BceA [Streptococcus gordonii]|jgi:ABC transporter, ATP-binding protein|uniref:ABC transporter, ATP-binding protein n=2 Tax=Streptococcus gordonii TaxID=1302 RepID=A8AWS5_STRGC|nr:ABC transporter ATP-binding protein [Streptococcus gordonii]ABV09518.1 ABC transporter, ATP-binding protein [Streptococcus gordonii str. Challis substr. CH1]KJQ63851.1 ABC transporter ATP-binding protein [Streptococcus gordonii]MBZ2137449.1 ABC transporter ATP-binding protein [Streptococcus gordonii]QGS43312.1 ATP-binding cassette domain-containing protein [Streptococcus gordonii]RSJ58999.1 Bacitracin export ATP-binding protein BceA [Streptococcus gordonii]
MIELKGVRKSYGANEVLKGIDLRIERQDYLVILGASGSGKSTLLNILSGLEKPDQGEVLYDGANIASLSENQLTKFRKDNIAFIFQQYYLLQELTVEQNVKMGAHLAKNQDYLPIIEAMGLKEKLHQYPSELSGGEQQRVAIARALAKKPKVLFLDEPTGALDEATGRQILSYIAQMKKELGFTLVMVTHNEHIAQLANTVVRVNSGQIQGITVNEEPKSVEEIGW